VPLRLQLQQTKAAALAASQDRTSATDYKGIVAMTNIFGTEHEATHTHNTTFPVGDQYKFAFPNGFGASVICNEMSYGNKNGEGLYELAVLKGASLNYDTPITDDVLGHLTKADVAETLKAIEALPKAGA
jgi:hypothetical protein